jgi:uncharacterized membrane protein
MKRSQVRILTHPPKSAVLEARNTADDRYYIPGSSYIFPRFSLMSIRFIQPNIFLYFFLLILGISGFFFMAVWPQATGFYAFIVFAATGGFGVASYIYYTKKSHKQLVCPVGSDCNAVITSRYSKFLGVSIEYLGMFYYAIIFIAYIFLIFVLHPLPGPLLAGLTMFTATAFFFSLYLLFAQAFLLRQWCIWCILSAALSIAIFIISLASIDFAVAFLAGITTVVEVIHVFGFAIGMGGATTALFLFLRFLRDLDIDEKEMHTLKEVSELVWLGLALILVGQFASYVAYAQDLAQSGPFLAQTIALFAIVVSGAVLMIIFTPFLAIIPFSAIGGSASGGNETAENHRHPLESLRKPLLIIGAIALSSWYFAFFMSYVPEYGLAILLPTYFTVLATAVAIALFWERRISRGRF